MDSEEGGIARPRHHGGGAPIGPEAVLSFWFERLSPRDWYLASDALDAEIRDRFAAPWEAARAGGLADWAGSARGALAYIVLTDQFPRNMFRGQGRAFATDGAALAAAKAGIAAGFDLAVPEPDRQFFYLPLMHSESLPDQERCCRLMLLRMPRTGASNLRHARAHREVIRRFGRFPYRNAALGRHDTDQEAAYLEAGGYAHTLRAFPETAPETAA